ncbi:hypothetical protein BJ322DRAFT_1110067 [Thelephora terrestris]|uniref:Uncharacterized protein n=1 Tax=Thelephora terrestris TaxID=56493 RepID=A0A9P6HD45_9AGAM|nr:hypothetical protein BJ322DRAFT_1110067 [Thelephora terrestris]
MSSNPFALSSDSDGSDPFSFASRSPLVQNQDFCRPHTDMGSSSQSYDPDRFLDLLARVQRGHWECTPRSTPYGPFPKTQSFDPSAASRARKIHEDYNRLKHKNEQLFSHMQSMSKFFAQTNQQLAAITNGIADLPSSIAKSLADVLPPTPSSKPAPKARVPQGTDIDLLKGELTTLKDLVRALVTKTGELEDGKVRLTRHVSELTGEVRDLQRRCNEPEVRVEEEELEVPHRAGSPIIPNRAESPPARLLVRHENRLVPVDDEVIEIGSDEFYQNVGVVRRDTPRPEFVSTPWGSRRQWPALEYDPYAEFVPDSEPNSDTELPDYEDLSDAASSTALTLPSTAPAPASSDLVKPPTSGETSAIDLGDTSGSRNDAAPTPTVPQTQARSKKSRKSAPKKDKQPKELTASQILCYKEWQKTNAGATEDAFAEYWKTVPAATKRKYTLQAKKPVPVSEESPST